MEKKWILIIIAYVMIACNTQIKNNNVIPEKYDFEAVKNSKTNPYVTKKGDTIVLMYKMTESGAYYIEYSDSVSFYHRVKYFYPNGIMESQGTCVGNGYFVGIWWYYDKKGNLVREEDKNAGFGKIKTDDILKFIEKEGWINLKTGEGREHPILKEGMEYLGIKGCRFSISFIDEQKKIDRIISIENKPPRLWIVNITTVKESGYQYQFTTYYIDGDTGEVVEKDSSYSPVFY